MAALDFGRSEAGLVSLFTLSTAKGVIYPRAAGKLSLWTGSVRHANAWRTCARRVAATMSARGRYSAN